MAQNTKAIEALEAAEAALEAAKAADKNGHTAATMRAVIAAWNTREAAAAAAGIKPRRSGAPASRAGQRQYRERMARERGR